MALWEAWPGEGWWGNDAVGVAAVHGERMTKGAWLGFRNGFQQSHWARVPRRALNAVFGRLCRHSSSVVFFHARKRLELAQCSAVWVHYMNSILLRRRVVEV
jgi:hypothetical protein